MGLDHLIGTPALKPYMHGYFLSLQLYDTARVIANPFAYAEHREKVVKEKMNKLSETRIRTRKNMAGIKVNKSLAEKIRKEEERENRKAERKKVKIRNGDSEGEHEMDVDVNVDVEAERSKEKRGQNPKPNLLNDPRFKALFENPEFQVDEDSREFALLNPSTAFQKRNGVASIGSSNKGKTRTAVEEEEEESEHESSDGLSHSDDDSQAEESKSEDSDDAGGNVVPRHTSPLCYLLN